MNLIKLMQTYIQGTPWIKPALIIFTFQIMMIFILQNPFLKSVYPSSRPHQKIYSQFHVYQAKSDPLVNSLYPDPALFALVTPRSFSGPLWYTYPSLNYEPMIKTPEFAGFQQIPKSQFTMLTETLKKISPTTVRIVTKPLQSQPIVSAPILPDRTQSVLKVTGPISNTRKLVTIPPLPSIKSTNLVPNSIVEVTISADGRVLSALLINSSGDPQADTIAVDIAKKAVFNPISYEGIVRPWEIDFFNWGTLVFEWYTSAQEHVGTQK